MSEQKTDDLLSPSLNVEPTSSGKKPWDVNLIGAYTFVGGTLAATVIMYINGKRLGLDKDKLRKTVIFGLIALVIVLLVGYFLPLDRLNGKTRSIFGGLDPALLAFRIVALIYLITAYCIQSSGHRVYAYKANGKPEFDTERGPIALIALAFAMIEFLLLYLVIECLKQHNFKSIEAVMNFIH